MLSFFKFKPYLDTHIQPPPSIEKPSSSSAAVLIPSPNFFSQLKPRRARSNTTGSTTTSNDTPPSQMKTTAGYKSFVDAFWNIHSKYKMSWECAELLIELGVNFRYLFVPSFIQVIRTHSATLDLLFGIVLKRRSQ